MREPGFIHLRLHSAHSLLEGAIQIGALAEACRKAGMPAVALTDTGNIFAAMEFSSYMAKAGVQPIIGCQLDLANAAPAHPGERPPPPRPVVLLAQDEAGYRNLMALSSASYLDAGDALPHLPIATLAAHAGGLICLTGGAGGPLGALIAEGQPARARALAVRLAELFPGRLYVEIQRHPEGEAPRTAAEEATEPGLVGLAYELDLPLVATNDVHFLGREMHEAQDALLCIADGAYVDQSQPRRRLTPEHHFKSADEMVALFADLPEAVENTVEIARRCAFRPEKRKPILPRFAADEVEELRAEARAGLAKRLAVIPHAAAVPEYEARLEFELGVIEGMGFPGYFLIVADFIKWAKERGIPVGPGRGSGAGSLVAYALTITDLDPLRYGLLFERFLNPERISMPDFDIDFCMDRRDEVIAYV
jgi:DNA polymerase-3 subunit alpha